LETQKKSGMCVIFAKKIMGGHETGGGLEQNWEACAPLGQGLKTPLSAVITTHLYSP